MKTSRFKSAALPALCLAMTLLAATGCGGGADIREPATEFAKASPVAVAPNIRGLVQVGSPLTNATVQLQAAGAPPVALVREATQAADYPRTNAYGSFAFTGKVPDGKAELVVRGGQLGDAAFTGTLRARLDNYQPGKDAAAVNVATTLVAAVMDAEPQLSLADAEAKVRAALKLPTGVPMKGMGSQYGLFDNAAFLKDAAATGFDAQVAQVAARIRSADTGVLAYTAAGRKSQQPAFRMKSGKGGAATDLLEWSIGEFAGGAVSYMGTNAFLYVLAQAGVPDFMGSGDMAAVRDALAQISAQLTNLSHQISDLQTQIGCDLAKEGYDGGLDGNRTTLFNRIDAYSFDMQVLASTDPGDTATIAQLRSDMNDIAKDFVTAHADIHDYVMGNSAAGTPGSIDLYSQVYKKCGPIIGPQKSQALKAQFDYMAVHQIMACNMVTSYYVGQGLSAVANKVASDCSGYLKDVQTRQIQALVQDGWVIDTRTNREWALTGYYYPSQPSSLLASVYAMGLNGDFYLASPADMASFTGNCYTGSGHEAFIGCMKNLGWTDSQGNAGFPGKDFFVYVNNINRFGSQLIDERFGLMDCRFANLYPYQFVGPDGNTHALDNCQGGAWMLIYHAGTSARYYN